MADFINGLYCKLEIDIGQGFKPVACLSENSINETSQTLETTTRENGGWEASIPIKQSYNVPLSGLSINTVYNGDDTKYSYDALVLLKRNKTIFDWKITNVINGDVDSGKGYIDSINKNLNIDEFIAFDANIKGVGIPIVTNITPIDTGLQSILQILI